MANAPEILATHSIGALAARFGVSLRTLRFYEERGLLRPEHHRGRRYYDGKDVVRLQIILLAKRFGFTINEIWELIETRKAVVESAPSSASDLGLCREEIAARVEGLIRQRQDVDAAIAELSEAMAAADGVMAS